MLEFSADRCSTPLPPFPIERSNIRQSEDSPEVVHYEPDRTLSVSSQSPVCLDSEIRRFKPMDRLLNP